MATTDARTGFRLPWSSDRSTDAEETTTTTDAGETTRSDGSVATETAPNAATSTATTADPGTPTDSAAEAPVAPEAPATSAETAAPEIGAAATPGPDTVAVAPRPPTKKPNRFLADLAKAMQAAAEEARGQSLAQLQADAKAHIESIHDRSSTDAATLRRRADDDVAAVREWSKAEIARIREETEQKITERKARLETEIDQHAAVIEREIEAVQRTVAAFETEMAAFFERLVTEEDPTRFAAMAENLPEPPTFDDLTEAMARLDDEAYEARLATATAPAEAPADVPEPAPAEATAEPATAEAVVSAEPVASTAADDEAPAPAATAGDALSGDAVSDSAETDAAKASFAPAQPDGSSDHANGEMDRESAFAAIQAAAEAAAGEDATATATGGPDVSIEIMDGSEPAGSAAEPDPRFAALGLTPDLDAAEAEALQAADEADAEEIPTIGDDALAARLADLVPPVDAEATGSVAATQVVVVGLVSVASIASFKRHLGRLPGVKSVGVSSGPDGEFVFAVSHEPDANLRDAIPSLPSFQARVTSATDSAIHVTAHDPEADG
ncbi:MAG TPA: hypothetical protein VFP22_10085 [Candidatus Limnocylindrales bacterium]|nr:hypothetical protein [Candidatus Limnocylindrales bacterium]